MERETLSPGGQRADGFYGRKRTKKVAIIFRAIHANYLLYIYITEVKTRSICEVFHYLLNITIIYASIEMKNISMLTVLQSV